MCKITENFAVFQSLSGPDILGFGSLQKQSFNSIFISFHLDNFYMLCEILSPVITS